MKGREGKGREERGGKGRKREGREGKGREVKMSQSDRQTGIQTYNHIVILPSRFGGQRRKGEERIGGGRK